MKNKLIVIVFFIFFSCKDDFKKELSIKENQPIEKKSGEFQLDSFVQQFISRTNFSNDSIYKEKLNLEISSNNKKGKYQYSVEKFGNLFDNTYEYIQIVDHNSYQCTIYIIKNKTIVRLISFEKKIPFNKTYTTDVNNDGQKDFIIISPTTGPVEFHICLLDKKTGLISNQIKTYNYYPIKNNGFIQVVNFRSPIVELKKMKWKGTEIDTIEKIYYDWEHPVYYKADKYPFKDFESSDTRYIYDPKVKVQILKKLPDDYIKAIKKHYPRFDE